MADTSFQSIPDFYKGKTLFITGGTGFMGKVLVEKLLWSCPGIEKIYLLLRPKKGVMGDERIKTLEKSLLFERLRTSRPGEFSRKVKCVNGDVTQLGLGLSPEDRQILINSVNIIFHSAASVRFDDPFKDAVILNTRGSRELMYLAREIKNLEVLLHVSTTYCNTDKNPVEEKLYPPHADWRQTIEIAERTDDHMLRILTAKYIDSLPNTYVFSKSCGEHVINDLRGNISAVIFRPSIVISSLYEPMPGWIENFNGPVGLLVASGKGIMRSVYSEPTIKADYMPVDIAIRAMIVAAWRHGVNKIAPSDPIPIYNCCSSNLKDITLQEIIDMGKCLTRDLPLNDILWVPGGDVTRYRVNHFIRVILFHLLPAVIVDLLLYFLGQKTLLIKVQRRIYIANLALQFYITNQWVFKNENLIELRTYISEKDKESFSYDFEIEDVFVFFKNCLIGARRYLLHEPDETIQKAKIHYRRMYVLDRILTLAFWCSMFYWMFNSVFVEKVVTGGLTHLHVL